LIRVQPPSSMMTGASAPSIFLRCLGFAPESLTAFGRGDGRLLAAFLVGIVSPLFWWSYCWATRLHCCLVSSSVNQSNTSPLMLEVAVEAADIGATQVPFHIRLRPTASQLIQGGTSRGPICFRLSWGSQARDKISPPYRFQNASRLRKGCGGA